MKQTIAALAAITVLGLASASAANLALTVNGAASVSSTAGYENLNLGSGTFLFLGGGIDLVASYEIAPITVGQTVSEINFSFDYFVGSGGPPLPSEFEVYELQTTFNAAIVTFNTLPTATSVGSLIYVSGNTVHFSVLNPSLGFGDTEVSYLVRATGPSKLVLTPSATAEISTNNVVVVPEPSAAVLGGLGVLALIRRRRA